MKNLEVVECKESLGRVYAILVDPENGHYVLAKGYDVLTGEWQETTGLTGSLEKFNTLMTQKISKSASQTF